MSTATLLVSGDRVLTSQNRDEQPKFAGGHATFVEMDDVDFIITVRYDSYVAKEEAMRSLSAKWPNLYWERGRGWFTLDLWLAR